MIWRSSVLVRGRWAAPRTRRWDVAEGAHAAP